MPYNADPYTGAQYLYTGISNAGKALGEAISQRLEEQKKQAKLFKAEQEIAHHAFGVDKDVTTRWDADKLHGFIQAKSVAQAMQEHAAKLDEFKAAADFRRAEAAKMQRATAADADLPKFFQGYYQDESNSPDVTMPNAGAPDLSDETAQQGQAVLPTPEARFRRGMEMGPLAPASMQFDNTFNSLQRQRSANLTPGSVLPAGDLGNVVVMPNGAGHFVGKENDANMPATFTEDPETGARFYERKNTSIPSGVNPKKISNDLTEAVDENGDPTGYMITRDPKGRPILRKSNRIKDQFIPAKDEKGNVIPDLYINPNNPAQAIDRRTEMQKMGAKPASSTAKSDDMVSVISPDGKKGSVPRSKLAEAKKQGYREQ